MSKQLQNIILTRVSLDVLQELTDVQAGQLFKAIRLYQIVVQLLQACVSVETIQSKTEWKDTYQDICLRDLQRLLKSSYVRLAFVACKTTMDEHYLKNNKTQSPPSPVKTREELQKDLQERSKEFYNSLIPFLASYNKDILRSFYNYWTEPNKSGVRLRFELEKTWDTAKRLENWARRELKVDKPAATGKETISNKSFDSWN